MINWLRTGEKPAFNDIFSGMKRFGELLPVFFLILLILFGYLLFIIPGVIMTVWWMYTLFLMADKRIPLLEAMAESRAKVSEKGFFMHFVFIVAIAIIPSILIDGIAAIIPPLAILHFFLFPFQCACQASLYLEQFGQSESIDIREKESGGFSEKRELPLQQSNGDGRLPPAPSQQEPPDQNDKS
jgi:hypothetical protein